MHINSIASSFPGLAVNVLIWGKKLRNRNSRDERKQKNAKKIHIKPSIKMQEKKDKDTS